MSGSGSFARQLQWGGHGGSFSHLKETLERSFVKPSFLHVFLFQYSIPFLSYLVDKYLECVLIFNLLIVIGA